jgi:acetyl esterase
VSEPTAGRPPAPPGGRRDRQPNAKSRTVLAERALVGGLPLHEATVAQSRAAQWEWVAHMGPQQPMAHIETRIIAAPTAEIPVRIYWPEGTHPGAMHEEPAPALVAFHGGCWIVGNIDVSDRPHRALAHATGCVVVAVNYQKAPEHPFPVPLQDCYAGFRWTLEHADELGIDPQRVGVVGDSAGGNLAAAVSLTARDLGEVLPAVQVLIYPALDAGMATESASENAEGFGLSTADMVWAYEQYVPDPAQRANPLVSPLQAPSLRGLPPAVVVTAEFDVLRDEGLRYADRLETDGVAVVRHHFATAIHGFLWMGASVDEGPQLLDHLARDLPTLWPTGSPGA